MLEKNIAVIGLRLIAVYLAILIINQLPFFASNIYLLFSQIDKFSFGLVILQTGIFVLTIAIPIILWKTAHKFANLIVGKTTANTNTEKLSSNDSWSALFAAVGIFIFLTSFSDLVLFICQTTIAIAKSNGVYLAERPSELLLIPIILKLILSLGLLFKSDFVVKLVRRVRQF